jgi:hypothetical protein
MIVKTIIQTCEACPSQWEGTLEDGRMFYARYRWGSLSIEVSKEPTSDVFIAMEPEGELIYYRKAIGGAYDGVLDQSDLVDIMKGLGFIFSLC